MYYRNKHAKPKKDIKSILNTLKLIENHPKLLDECHTQPYLSELSNFQAALNLKTR